MISIKQRRFTEWATLAASVAVVPLLGHVAGWVMAFIPMLIVAALMWQEDVHGVGVDVRPVALAFAWILINAADALITLSILWAIPGAAEANPVMELFLSHGWQWFVVGKMAIVTLIALRVQSNAAVVRAGLVLLSVVIVNNVLLAAVLMWGAV